MKTIVRRLHKMNNLHWHYYSSIIHGQISIAMGFINEHSTRMILATALSPASVTALFQWLSLSLSSCKPSLKPKARSALSIDTSLVRSSDFTSCQVS